jgi:hypothetical protein
MNRRNFILGLGTAATLSGAASVTGASLSNTVDTGANFQIVATNQLNVERNNELDSTALGNNGNYSDKGGDFDTDFVNTTSFPNMTIDDQANDQLNMSFATDNDNASAYNRNGSFGDGVVEAGQQPYNGSNGGNRVAPLQVVNNGGTSKDVAVTYDYGSDVSQSADPSALDIVDINRLFEFEIDGVQVSPDGSTTDSGANAVTFAAGQTREVDFTLNYNADLEEKISDAASGGGSDFGFGSGNSANAAADLLNRVTFGTSSQTGVDPTEK